jgi:hypothetical protein
MSGKDYSIKIYVENGGAKVTLKRKVPPCLIKFFENWPEKLIILFAWPNVARNST